MQELTLEQKLIALVVANPHKKFIHCALSRAADGLGISDAHEDRRWRIVKNTMGLSLELYDGIMAGWDDCCDCYGDCMPHSNPYVPEGMEPKEWLRGYKLGVDCFEAAYNK